MDPCAGVANGFGMLVDPEPNSNGLLAVEAPALKLKEGAGRAAAPNAGGAKDGDG